ncbi:hypothetical protein K227x_56810 [Rubripirellula lacrimiformis]|uniref:Uncharacterized protein n=1 Tax=Rubripirellula lacrimiformis TaxID=1930273 RepID=A0A517NJD7_9BACT|nr:hypothetical protein K227x_56810 [Rubripirellula lacrimiformis]
MAETTQTVPAAIHPPTGSVAASTNDSSGSAQSTVNESKPASNPLPWLIRNLCDQQHRVAQQNAATVSAESSDSCRSRNPESIAQPE